MPRHSVPNRRWRRVAAIQHSFTSLRITPADLIGRRVAYDSLYDHGDGVIAAAAAHQIPWHDGHRLQWAPSDTHADIAIRFNTGSLAGRTIDTVVTLTADGAISHQALTELEAVR